MPSWTLGEMMSTVTARLGYRSDLAASTVSMFVNEAYLQVAHEARPEQLERVAYASIASGDSRVAKPVNMMMLRNLSYLSNDSYTGSQLTLEQTSIEEIDAHGFYPRAMPTHYAEYRDWIELWPSPNSAHSLQIRYWSYATDMISTTQKPSIDTPYRTGIIYLAEALLHEHLGNNEEGAIARARFATYVGSLNDARARRQAAKGKRAAKLLLRGSRWA